MNLKEIKEMINLMNENDLTEIEIEREGTKIKIKKASSEDQHGFRRHPPEFKVEAIPAPRAAEEKSVNDNPKTSKGTVISSPMVGTFYRAPSPESASFAETGQVVEVGQVVCIIEAMKLMNEIKSEILARVVEIAVQNAEPVEFGQTLFIL